MRNGREGQDLESGGRWHAAAIEKLRANLKGLLLTCFPTGVVPPVASSR